MPWEGSISRKKFTLLTGSIARPTEGLTRRPVSHTRRRGSISKSTRPSLSLGLLVQSVFLLMLVFAFAFASVGVPLPLAFLNVKVVTSFMSRLASALQ